MCAKRLGDALSSIYRVADQRGIDLGAVLPLERLRALIYEFAEECELHTLELEEVLPTLVSWLQGLGYEKEWCDHVIATDRIVRRRVQGIPSWIPTVRVPIDTTVPHALIAAARAWSAEPVACVHFQEEDEDDSGQGVVHGSGRVTRSQRHRIDGVDP